AFGHTLAPGRYPVGFIAVQVPPHAFDVNVHPQKTEVRFANPQAVFRAVAHVVGAMAARSPWSHAAAFEIDYSDSRTTNDSTLNDAGVAYRNTAQISFPAPPASGLLGYTPGKRSAERVEKEALNIPVSGGERPENFVTPAKAGGQRDLESQRFLDSRLRGNDRLARHETITGAGGISTSADSGQESSFSALRFVGQVRNMFLIMEDVDDLVIIDQHAAHERVTYEKLRKQLAGGRIASQRLLTPHMIDLGPAETERIMEKQSELARLGLEVEQAGADRIAVYGVPPEISASPERLLAELVIALEQGREGTKGDLEDKAVATLACHSSIRAGRTVLEKEVVALLAQMDNVDFAGHCPHGRPVLARIPFSEIRRRVHRE
ncbi:MAG: hypothetical protein JXX14_08505, partial [Deltaproteobacteria bacterium]|nr:hypothetical protein [Deltaproteobacteria bacterium]